MHNWGFMMSQKAFRNALLWLMQAMQQVNVRARLGTTFQFCWWNEKKLIPWLQLVFLFVVLLIGLPSNCLILRRIQRLRKASHKDCVKVNTIYSSLLSLSYFQQGGIFEILKKNCMASRLRLPCNVMPTKDKWNHSSGRSRGVNSSHFEPASFPDEGATSSFIF